ncbi:MAG: RNA chaperone Hfq [Deltaproteobacteria bacterium]|nr:RNA chaperone Hfq [Deltaproteobacteria bacterium]
MIEERGLDSLIRKPARSGAAESKDPGRRPPTAKKSTPPDQTNAEQFYYSKQMQGKTHMVVVLTDGEQLEGVIEWYDRECLKLNRIGAPNLLLFKRCIKYMYKAEPE